MLRMIRLFLRAAFALVGVVVVLWPTVGRADTFTLLDATDYGGSFGVRSTNPGRVVITLNSLSTGLAVHLLPPSPTAVFLSDACPLGQILCSHLNIGEYPVNSDFRSDFESDVFFGGSIDHVTYNLFLFAQTTFPCAAEGGCLVREDGLLHALDTVTWSDGTVDTVNFQSTPEPTSFCYSSRY
jgi:hypothetical protein